MDVVTRVSPVKRDDLESVDVYPMDEDVAAGEPQEVFVDAEAGARIPLHRHGVDATMFIVGGRATLLSEKEEANGRTVTKGDKVFFERNVGHGFDVSEEGLAFISRNGGIVDTNPDSWDIEFLEEA